jgi:aldose 1-epimerase
VLRKENPDRMKHPEVVTLTDSSSGAEAKILAGYGFNCFHFRVERDGQPLDILWSEPDFERGDKRASGSGIPLLFPYPGRLRGQSLTWNGRTYPLEGDDRRGNAIHGFVLTRPWRVIEQTASRVVGQFQASVDDARLLACWPADFRITATYKLAGNTLRSTFVIENPDDKPMPCGFGTHPYFNVPLGGSSADDCRVRVPARRQWELLDMLPTGRSAPVEEIEQFRAGLRFGDMSFDGVFTDLEFESHWCTARVIDPQTGGRLVVQFDDAFRECVVYTPPHRQAVCIEPYTCVPNAPELQAAGVDAGLRVLKPTEQFTAEVILRFTG